jgi:hypothetical protein
MQIILWFRRVFRRLDHEVGIGEVIEPQYPANSSVLMSSSSMLDATARTGFAANLGLWKSRIARESLVLAAHQKFAHRGFDNAPLLTWIKAHG